MVEVGIGEKPLQADVVIAGAGIIGLALALELQLRGISVAVLERERAMRGASWAAGGMLAVEDPQNPPELMELARLSGRLYPEWLRRVEELSGMSVPIRTRQALQWVGPKVEEGIAAAHEIGKLAPGLRTLEGIRFRLLEEGSVDPRDLCAALPKAVVAAGGRLFEECGVSSVSCLTDDVRIRTGVADFTAEKFVNCCGAWAGTLKSADLRQRELPVEPVKGQMVELCCAPERLRCVVRAPEVYLIPRGDGRVTVGATLERAGFDVQVEEGAIRGLVVGAQRLMPELEIPHLLKSWAGLRPGTPDGLPVMGHAADAREANGRPRCWHATGHYRDGILLAPGTARIMAQAITGERPDVPMEAFSAARFARASARN